ncbi:sulfotransferase family protein [Geodermatophilus marinus]|uniref:sulfotransferase family protein n=1 Tax=Geodermatophilus sp. LHW52908 TaxID=2303986 RepID=UPI000E3DEE7B|nr:sulfotransferase [Geodermatophilus sp. LHW52908]RFU22403.1 sulfotransferase [Geodermatophilus sp. LHW52908]
MTPSDTRGRLPNLLIAGVSKAGTTSLFRYLAQHPDICPADVKELRYFSALRYGEPLAPLESYSRHFAHCRDHRYRMEATPGYYAGGRLVADAVAALLPDARVVVSFRDPVQRCWSWYRFVRSTARIPKDMTFAEYLDRCETLHRGSTDGLRVNQPFWGLGGGCYDFWIDAWMEIFGERLRVEFFENVIRDPRAVVEGLCTWLRIDTSVCASLRYGVENKTVQYRNKKLQQLALTVHRRSERFLTAHPGLKRSVRSAYYAVNSEHTDERLGSAERQRLDEFYGPHNDRLATRLETAGLNHFPDWLHRHRQPRGDSTIQ